MPEGTPHVHRVHDEASAIARQNAEMREVVAKALEILRMPVPDTFLGRKTHEPFPSEAYMSRRNVR